MFLVCVPDATEELQAVVQTSIAIRVDQEWPMIYAELLTMKAFGFLMLQGELPPWMHEILRKASEYLVELPLVPVLGQRLAWPAKPLPIRALLDLFEDLMPQAAALNDPDESPPDQIYVARRNADRPSKPESEG